MTLPRSLPPALLLLAGLTSGVTAQQADPMADSVNPFGVDLGMPLAFDDKTEAAAATVGHKKTGCILFMGRVDDPTKA